MLQITPHAVRRRVIRLWAARAVLEDVCHYEASTKATKTTAVHPWPRCAALYLCWHRNSTVSACRILRSCSLADDCRTYTSCRPMTARRDHPGRSRSPSAGSAATPAADSARVVVVNFAVSLATAGRYKCLGKTPRWSRPVVLKSEIVYYYLAAALYRFIAR